MKKEELISTLVGSRQQILNLLEGIPPEQMEIPGVIEQWSLKDLLVHMTRWEAELVKLLWQTKQGNRPTTVHFNQNGIDTINDRWYQESKSRPMEMVWKDFIAVRDQTLRRVKDFSDDELNNQQAYNWLDGKALREWIAEDSYKHEAEHAENIQEWKDRLDESI